MPSLKIIAAVVVLLFAIYTVNVESQENIVDTGNPSGVDIAKADPVAAPAQSAGTEPDPAVNTVEKSKPGPQKPPGRRRRPTNRRRQRKRRPRPANLNRQNGTGGGKVKVPEVQQKPDLKPKAKAVIKPETKAVSIGKAEKLIAKKPKQIDPAFDQDPFFAMFSETTTVEPDVNAPPPHFSVDAPPNKKVMPTLGPSRDAHDGTPCNETYKAHNTSTKYMMKYAEGVWETLDCPPNLGTGLVWRQDLCSCGEELIPQDPDDWCGSMGYNPHPQNRNKYTRKNHGVDALMDCPGSLIWSQKKCQCIFDPAMRERPIENRVTFTCKTILQLEFEGDLKNSALGYHVETVDLRRRGKLPRIRFRQIPGSTNKAAMIVSQPLEFLAFRGNDFQKQVTYSLAFKISPRHETKTSPMILMTDECIGNPGGQNKARKPSIALSFIPSTKTFRLQFRTGRTEIDQLIEGALPDVNGWYKVVIYFQDETVNLESGGKLLFTQKNILGKIPQNKCPLYIAGRGRGFDRSMDFYGYLDSVYLVKDCTFHEANIKFL